MSDDEPNPQPTEENNEAEIKEVTGEEPKEEPKEPKEEPKEEPEQDQKVEQKEDQKEAEEKTEPKEEPKEEPKKETKPKKESPTLSAIPEDTVIYKGFLTKKGSNFHSWKRRCFILTKEALFYYERDTPLSALLGSYQFSQTTVLVTDPEAVSPKDKKHKFLFAVSDEDRVLKMFADTEEDKKKWCEELEKVLAVGKTPSINGTFSGWLNKESSSMMRSWNKRWIVLQEKTLVIFESPSNRIPKGKFNVAFVVENAEQFPLVLKKRPSREMPFAFAVTDDKGKVQFFSAETEEIRNEWTGVLLKFAPKKEPEVEPKKEEKKEEPKEEKKDETKEEEKKEEAKEENKEETKEEKKEETKEEEKKEETKEEEKKEETKEEEKEEEAKEEEKKKEDDSWD